MDDVNEWTGLSSKETWSEPEDHMSWRKRVSRDNSLWHSRFETIVTRRIQLDPRHLQICRPLIVALVYAIRLLKCAQTSVPGLHPLGIQLVQSLFKTAQYAVQRRPLLSSKHAIADICCLRQQTFDFHYVHNLPLHQKLDPHMLPFLKYV